VLAKPKKVSKTALKAKADKLASQYYRAQTPYCEMAGLDEHQCAGVLNWAHIIGRANLRLRYEPYNHLILCAGEHLFFTHHPLDWIRALEKHYPERLRLAEQHRHEIVKCDYQAYIGRFTALPESQD